MSSGGSLGFSDNPSEHEVESPFRTPGTAGSASPSSREGVGYEVSSEPRNEELSLVIAGPPVGIPKDIEPLSILPADRSEGTPSTSEPTHILNKNSPSRVNPEMMRDMRILYRFPKSIGVRLAGNTERVDYKIPGWIAFYERPFEDGLRFPVPSLVRDVLNHFEVAPSQLMPNTWRILLSIECLAYNLGIGYGVRDLLYTYALKEHLKDKGRYLLFLRQKREPIVLGLPTNDRGGWQKYYFFVRGEMVFGSSGAQQFPEHWSTSSKYFSNLIHALVHTFDQVLIALFVAGLHRNRLLEPTKSVERNTQRVLEVPPEERNWRYILEESRLRATPLWQEALAAEGTSPLPLRQHIFSVISGTWSCQLLYRRLLFLKPLTPEEILCAAEIMASSYKYPSVEELEEKRKRRKTKGKSVVSIEQETQPQVIVTEEIPKSAGTSPGRSASKKRKQPVDTEQYSDEVVLKIPRSTTAISDPSGLDPFVDGLLLEEDEHRLKELGPIETARRLQAQTFQALESSIFLRKYAENCQRRMRELEKSNTSLRKELSESTLETGAAYEKLSVTEGRLKEAESVLELERATTKIEIDSYKEVVGRLEEKEKALIEEMDEIAYGAMIRERGKLATQYLSGEHINWPVQKWARVSEKLEAGESPYASEEEKEEGAEVVIEESAGDGKEENVGEKVTGDAGVASEDVDILGD